MTETTNEEVDPEYLPPVEKIRHAEQLIRRDHRIRDDDWLFWGKLADYLNNIAHTPEKANSRESDWRDFNRATDMATGYIRISRLLNQLKPPDPQLLQWHPGEHVGWEEHDGYPSHYHARIVRSAG